MAGSLGSIFVDLLLRTGRFDDALNKSKNNVRGARTSWGRDLSTARTDFSRFGADVEGAINRINGSIGTVAGIVAGAFSVSEIARYSDAWKQLEGRLNLVSETSTQLALTQERLFNIAQMTRSDLGATVTLYQRLTSAVQGLGISEDEVYKFTEQLNKQLITAGLTSNEASAAIYQLTQAFNKGKLDGDEFRTLLESAPPILEALEKSLKVTRGEILQMSQDGKLAPQVLVDAVNSMADVTDARFAAFSLTIGQAFQQLDNAFMKYLGQSDAVNAGTNTIALAVSELADNLETIADIGIVVAGIFGVRLVSAVAASTAAMVASRVAAVAETAALNSATVAAGGMTRMSMAMVKAQQAAAGSFATTTIVVGSTGRAVVATTSAMGTMIATSRALGAALLGAIGGPIGLAVTAALVAFAFDTNEAVEAQERYNDILGEVAQMTGQYAGATEDARNRIVTAVQDRINALRSERIELSALMAEYSKRNLVNAFKLGAQEIAGKLGIGTPPSEIIEQWEAVSDAIAEAQRNLSNAMNPVSLKNSGGGSSADELEKEAKRLQGIYDSNRVYITGLDAATLKYQDTQKELAELFYANKIGADEYASALERLKSEFDEAQLREVQGLYDANRRYILGLDAATINYMDTLEDLKEVQEAGLISTDELAVAVANLDKEYQESTKTAAVWAFDVEEAAKQASRNIQDTLADFLFDPFAEGLGGMLEGFEQMLRKMVAQAAAAQILSGLFGQGGIGSGGGVLGGIGQGIGSAFAGMFADGGYIPPGQWGIAGEAGPEVITGGNTGASVIPMGRGGGGGVTVNVINNSDAKVSTSSRQGSNGVELDVMIDQLVAQNILTQGSRTNQAMNARDGRSMVRR